MAKTDKIPTTTFGKKVHLLTPANIKNTLMRDRTELGWSFIYEEHTMIGIHRWSDNKRGPFTYSVDELDGDEEGVFEILSIDFTEDEVDDAVKLFLYLLEHPYKIGRNKMLKKLPPVTIARTYTLISAD